MINYETGLLKGIIMARKILLTLFFITSITTNIFAANSDRDHLQLRELLQLTIKALNEGQIEQAAQYFDTGFTLITMDNKKYSSIEEFKVNYDNYFNAPNAPLKKMSINPVASDKTFFITDDVGLVNGTSTEKYYFSDSDVRDIETKWSAVVHKVAGQWKIKQVHFSANVLDNPVLNAVKAMMIKFIISAFFAGTLIGLIIMNLINRAKK